MRFPTDRKGIAQPHSVSSPFPHDDVFHSRAGCSVHFGHSKVIRVV